jgi:protein-disulfide isomerase
MYVRVLAALWIAAFATTAAAKVAEDTVVAVVGGQKITYGEIRKKIGLRVDQMEAKYLIERRTVESDALRELIEGALLEGEAKRRGLTAEALVEAEVTKKTPAPTHEEVKKVYERAKGQLNLPLEALRPRIEEFLRTRASGEVRQKFLDELRTKANVRESLPMPDLPAVVIPEDGAPAKGPADAPIKLVVFSDFECPYCSRVVPTLHELFKKYQGKVRMAFRDFPLDFHENARRAAEAAHCANEQGKFWEYHDRLFAHQDKLGEKDLIEHAKEVQADTAALEKCLKAGKYGEVVTRNYKAGGSLGVNGTPAIFVNGILLSGAQPLKAFTDLIDAFLSKSGTR